MKTTKQDALVFIVFIENHHFTKATFVEIKMKVGCMFLFCCLFLAASVHCYDERRFDPIKELIKAHRAKTTFKSVSENASVEDHANVYVGIQDGLKETDKIVNLPGQPEVSFSQYSGYVTVDPSAGRALFYYFTESEQSSHKPLVLWLNGGPGCSSLGGGAMRELGPFRVNPDGKTLWYNKNAWNNVANVIFLESPAGVRFSYSNRSSDYVTGDKKTADDSFTFLVNWLERFPEYKNRDFYISGESYAGHYVPQLAALILKNNEIANQTVINLKGIAIGNPYIDGEDLSRGTYDYYWTHALISDEIHQGIVENCNFSSMASFSKQCQDFEFQADRATANIFPYDIYAPLCSSPPSTAPSVSTFDPCTRNYVRAYLNMPDVQKALHANVTGIPRPWDSCRNVVDYNSQDVILTVLPTIKELMASGISVWIYSGDTDSVVPITSTKYSLAKIGAPTKTPWRPWYTRGEVGGYVVEYQNITFATVRGAGHYVPSYQPERALALFSAFLEGKLPSSER